MAADLPKDMLFDVRIAARNVRKGLATKKDLEKHLKDLDDVAERGAPLEAKLEHRSHAEGAASTVVAARKVEEEEEEID
jgi:hypothetical protein